MAEYKKEIGVAGAVAVAVALGVGLFAIAAFPSGQTSASHSILSPEALLGYVSARGVICSIATGACTMTLVNNSTVPLTVEGCRIATVTNTSGTVTTWGLFNGTSGGPALVGIPAASSYTNGSEVPASCTIPASDFSHSPKGSVVSGGFTVKLASNWHDIPSGYLSLIDFATTWS